MHVSLQLFIFISLSNDFTLSLQQQNPSNEVMALLGFKQKYVASDPHGLLNDWRLESLTPCSWRCVSCSLHGKVTMLNLTDAGLIGRLHLDGLNGPENFFPDKASHPSCIVETLDLLFNNLLEQSNYSLYGTGIPRSLINCQLFETLDVSFNKLQGEIAASLGNLRNLKHLNLAQNTFSSNISPEMDSMCGTLIELDLSGKELPGDFPETFKSSMACKGSTLEAISFQEISSLQSLVIFLVCKSSKFNSTTLMVSFRCLLQTVLSFKFLILVPMASMATYPQGYALIVEEYVKFQKTCSGTQNLGKLALNNNGFTRNIPASITNCTNLSWLSLSFNRLTGTIPTGLHNLQKLSILQLSYNSFSGNIQTIDLGSFKNLIWLDLGSNQFTGQIPSILATQKRFDPIFSLSSKGG
ncbi:serine/threonine-protein kinase BRI1-like 1 [Hibiscus syriacus]|uniref:serine/threonine-protein kinase BRI1-like 1 n=1 Tax=Hibiscus syriacus TaxID=106335 RepID=UPI001922E734|nr:serine/threonine-protein kinase BRI1-like 1 [Hibiscus syriacus]